MKPWAILLIGHADFVVIGALFLTLAISLLQKNPPHRRAKEWLLLAALAVLPGEGIAATIVTSLSKLRPGKIDLYVCWIDSFFGYPGFRVGQFVYAHFWARILSSISYGLLGSAMLATVAVYLWQRPDREALAVATAFIINLFGAIPIYLLFPVCGPIYAFPNFPALPSAHFALQPIALAFPPNGVPSVHTSTALLVLWFLRRWPSGRIFGSIFLALTVFSTLGAGEHYLVDLICAFPYALCVAWCTPRLIGFFARYFRCAEI
jgi:hypothetical protein